MIPNVILPGDRERIDVCKDKDKELAYNGEFCNRVAFLGSVILLV